MKLGVMIDAQEGLIWERWRRLLAEAEVWGFESIWLTDRCLSLLGPERAALETWTALTVAAAETTRLRLGSLVSPITFRHPSLLARMAAAVDLLSGGRLEIGIGAGWNEREHRAFGIPFPPLGQRLDMLEEGLEVLIRLLRDGPASFAGRYFQLDGAEMLPKPAQRPRPPLLIGGKGERRTLRIVAKYADEWNLNGGTVALYRAKAARLAEHCRASGRDPTTLRHSLMAAFIVGGSRTELHRRTDAIRRVLISLPDGAADAVLAEQRAKGWLTGTPDQIVGQLQELADAGVQRVMLQHWDQADFGALALLAREVLPAFSTPAAATP